MILPYLKFTFLSLSRVKPEIQIDFLILEFLHEYIHIYRIFIFRSVLLFASVGSVQLDTIIGRSHSSMKPIHYIALNARDFVKDSSIRLTFLGQLVFENSLDCGQLCKR